MSSTKEYRDYILEQLRDLPGITCRPMMGEFLLYLDGVLFGGIYDDRLLVKIVPENEHYKMAEEIPVLKRHKIDRGIPVLKMHKQKGIFKNRG